MNSRQERQRTESLGQSERELVEVLCLFFSTKRTVTAHEKLDHDMLIAKDRTWQLLFTNKPVQLWLRGSLSNGQCFNWSLAADAQNETDDEIWEGVLGNRVIWLKQATFTIEHEFLPPVYFSSIGGEAVSKSELEEYFRHEVDLDALYLKWSENCTRFAQISSRFRGIRILRQDKLECMLSFITSSNNNIKRIHSLLAKFRQEFGQPITPQHYSFPTLQALLTAPNFTEQKLREMGFGYRAKYIAETVRLLGRNDCKLWELEDDSEALTEELCKLSGVGRKVADCISLFAFNRLDVVPVDVHVFRIAKRDYNTKGELDKFTTMNKTVYAKVYDEFYSRFGNNVGWAHSVLFTCELAAFRDRVPQGMIKEMDAFKRSNSSKSAVVVDDDSESESEEDSPQKKRTKRIVK